MALLNEKVHFSDSYLPVQVNEPSPSPYLFTDMQRVYGTLVSETMTTTTMQILVTTYEVGVRFALDISDEVASDDHLVKLRPADGFELLGGPRV